MPGVDAATGLRDVNPVTHWKQTIWFNSQELAPVRKPILHTANILSPAIIAVWAWCGAG